MIHRQTTKSRRWAGGFTLVELLVTITLLGMLTGIATQLLVRVLQADSRMKVHYAEQHALYRLERTLREDALVANSWTGATSRSFIVDDEVAIHYSIRGPYVIREVSKGAEVVSREQYRLPDGAMMVWPSEGKLGALLTWELAPGPENNLEASRHVLNWRLVTGIGLSDSDWTIAEVKR
jgi:prepilin-type N-terminal cleavage/methylation domain-containing protein